MAHNFSSRDEIEIDDVPDVPGLFVLVLVRAVQARRRRLIRG